jgi:hypothetical protein
MSLSGSLIGFVVELQAITTSLKTIEYKLNKSQRVISKRIIAADESHRNHEKSRHIVGIERWGQHRLRCALDEALVMDEVDDYILADSHFGIDIAQDFDVTRQETLALIQGFLAAPGSEKRKVPHNDLGPLSVKGWLVYLNLHAEMESKKLRK